MRRLILIPLLVFLSLPAIGQRGFSVGRIGARFPGRMASSRGGRHARWVGYPVGPLFWDSMFYPDDITDSGYPGSAQPVIVIQQPSAAPATTPAPAAPEPLLIEFRGGRYVQITGAQSSAVGSVDQQTSPYIPRSSSAEATQPPATSPSTLLVFRDGSREEIRGYTIADGVLYIQTNFYNDGSSQKPLAVSSLDLAETLRENRARGLDFRLPAAANEVIVGP